MGGVGRRVILRGDLDEIGAHEIEAPETAQQRLRLTRREAPNLRRAGAGSKPGRGLTNHRSSPGSAGVAVEV